MALASKRVEHDGAANGRNAHIEVPHEGGKSAARSQNLGIARRERKGPLVFFTRLREVEGSIFRKDRQCEVGLGEIRREDKRLARIRQRLVIACTHRRGGLGFAGDRGKGDRSGGKRERIVRIEADRFRVGGNRGGEVLVSRLELTAFAPRRYASKAAGLRVPPSSTLAAISPSSVTLRALATAVAISVWSLSTSPKSRS